MHVFIKKIIDLVLYSNLWIAVCAAAMVAQTQFVLTGVIKFNPLLGLVFFSTLFLYAIHRIIGIRKVKDFLEIERFAVISTFKSHITIYAVLAAIGGLYTFLQLQFDLQLLLILPALISLGYVLPIFGNQKRLRDFDQIKIILIAVVWSLITVVMVVIDEGFSYFFDKKNGSYLFLTIERFCFIFAITLPFDIRDLKVDRATNVKTIPAKIGVQKSIYWAIFLIFLALVCSIFSNMILNNESGILVGQILFYLLVPVLIYQTKKSKHDYFFSGLMDGTMLFSLLFILFFTELFS